MRAGAVTAMLSGGARALLGLPLCLPVLGCAPSPRPIEYQTGGELPGTDDGLHRVRALRVGAAYLKPGASFADYDRIIVDPVAVYYKRPPKRSASAGGSRENSALTPAEMDRFKRMFQEAFAAEIAKSEHFALTDVAAPNALRVSAQVVDLVVEAPPDRGRDVSYVVQSGEMTLILDVRDSETGEALGRMADRRAIRPASGGASSLYRSTAVRSWSDMDRLFRRWAGLLREGLDELSQLPEMPQP